LQWLCFCIFLQLANLARILDAIEKCEEGDTECQLLKTWCLHSSYYIIDTKDDAKLNACDDQVNNICSDSFHDLSLCGEEELGVFFRGLEQLAVLFVDEGKLELL